MAAALARRVLGTSSAVESCGVTAVDGAPAARHAITVMGEKGLDIGSHAARGIDSLDVSSFDVVVALDPDVARRLRHRGVDTNRLVELNIADPYGNDIDRYRSTVSAVERELERLFPSKTKQ